MDFLRKCLEVQVTLDNYVSEDGFDAMMARLWPDASYGTVRDDLWVVSCSVNIVVDGVCFDVRFTADSRHIEIQVVTD